MQTPRPPQRPRLTLPILVFAAIDIVGMLLFATGALWFAHGKALFVPGYPANSFEAGIAIAGGLLLMFWAGSRLLRELFLSATNDTQEPDR